MDLSKFDVSALKDGLTESLRVGFKDVVQGTEADVELFAQALAADLFDVIEEGNADAEAQIRDQIKVLAEINRVRVNGFAWATAERIARVAAELLEATIKAAL